MIFFIIIILSAILIILLFPAAARAGQFSRWPINELEIISKFGLNSAVTNLSDLEKKYTAEKLKKNNIHSKTSWCHPISSNITYKSRYEEYDKNGMLIKTAVFDRDGRILNVSEYAYDGDGYLGECTEYNPTGSVSSKLTRIYDKDHNLLESKYFEDGDELVYIYTYHYSAGMVEEIRHSARENTEEKIAFKYEGERLIQRSYPNKEDGSIITETYYYDEKSLTGVTGRDGAGIEIFKWNYICDTQKYPLIEEYIDYIKNIWISRTFEYDQNHSLLKYIHSLETDSDKTITITIFTYSREGDLIKSIYDGHKKNKLVETVIFDKESLPVKSIEYDDNGRPLKHYKYEFRQFYSEKIVIDSKIMMTEENIKMECTRNMRLIEGNIDLYSIEKGKSPENLDTLVKSGHLSKLPKCPRDGRYSFSLTEDGLLNLNCSFHGNLY